MRLLHQIFAVLALLHSASGCRERTAQSASVSAPAPIDARRPVSEVIAPCGNGDAPDCPLQEVMNRVINPAKRDHTWDVLGQEISRVEAVAPPGFAHWKDWTERVRLAAERGDATAVRDGCFGCHDEYQERYRLEQRRRSVPTLASVSRSAEPLH